MKRAHKTGPLPEIKADIAAGLSDVAAGRIKDFNPAQIIARGRKLLADQAGFARPGNDELG